MARFALTLAVVTLMTLLHIGCADADYQAQAAAAAAQPASPQATAGDDSGAASDTIDEINRRIDELFADVVTEVGLVKYDRLRGTHRETLASIADDLARPREFATDQQRLAFLINAYNINVLNQVLAHWPVKKVIDVPGFFDKTKVTVAGRQLTLNELENDEIRKYHDPRIHAALVCAAMSCPPLLNEAYTDLKLDKQLSEVTTRWVNDPTKNRAEGGVVYASKIIEWYADDFNAGPYGSVAGFFRHFAEPGSALAKAIAAEKTPEIRYLEYDWQLNDASH